MLTTPMASQSSGMSASPPGKEACSCMASSGTAEVWWLPSARAWRAQDPCAVRSRLAPAPGCGSSDTKRTKCQPCANGGLCPADLQAQLLLIWQDDVLGLSPLLLCSRLGQGIICTLQMVKAGTAALQPVLQLQAQPPAVLHQHLLGAVIQANHGQLRGQHAQLAQGCGDCGQVFCLQAAILLSAQTLTWAVALHASAGCMACIATTELHKDQVQQDLQLWESCLWHMASHRGSEAAAHGGPAAQPWLLRGQTSQWTLCLQPSCPADASLGHSRAQCG